jgi:hypothetical protein
VLPTILERLGEKKEQEQEQEQEHTLTDISTMLVLVPSYLTLSWTLARFNIMVRLLANLYQTTKRPIV